MGINTGLRISDLLKLKLRDVANENYEVLDHIIMREMKTGKIKQIPLNGSVKDALYKYLKYNSNIDLETYLFKSQKGKNKPISRVQAWEILRKAAKKAGIVEPIGTHSLRKTFGYHAYQAGIDITLLQNIFNHSAPSITLRYIGITQDDINNVYMGLNL